MNTTVRCELEPEHHGGIQFFSQVVPRPMFRMLPCLYVLPFTHPCRQPFRSTYLHHAMMDGCVLLLLQHHQGDDNHCCYDNAAHHESNDGTFVWTHIFCKEHLENKPRKRTVSGGDTGRSKVSADPRVRWLRWWVPTNEQSMASQVLRSQYFSKQKSAGIWNSWTAKCLVKTIEVPSIVLDTGEHFSALSWFSNLYSLSRNKYPETQEVIRGTRTAQLPTSLRNTSVTFS